MLRAVCVMIVCCCRGVLRCDVLCRCLWYCMYITGDVLIGSALLLGCYVRVCYVMLCVVMLCVCSCVVGLPVMLLLCLCVVVVAARLR